MHWMYALLISLRQLEPLKKAQLETYFEDMNHLTKSLEHDPSVANALIEFEKGFEEGLNSARFAAAEQQYGARIRELNEINGFYDLFLIAPDGDIVYTATKEADFGTNVINGAYSGSGITEAFNNGKNGISFIDFAFYEPSNGAAAFMSAPMDIEGEFIGVLVIQVPMEGINGIMLEQAGLGGNWRNLFSR